MQSQHKSSCGESASEVTIENKQPHENQRLTHTGLGEVSKTFIKSFG